MTKKRRNEVQHPALDNRYNSKIRQEYIDYDYKTKLTEEEKEFLNKFTEEYYGAGLDYDNLENNIHNTPELKKACTDRNNAQNRCLYGISKATGKLDFND